MRSEEEGEGRSCSLAGSSLAGLRWLGVCAGTRAARGRCSRARERGRGRRGDLERASGRLGRDGGSSHLFRGAQRTARQSVSSCQARLQRVPATLRKSASSSPRRALAPPPRAHRLRDSRAQRARPAPNAVPHAHAVERAVLLGNELDRLLRDEAAEERARLRQRRARRCARTASEEERASAVRRFIL